MSYFYVLTMVQTPFFLCIKKERKIIIITSISECIQQINMLLGSFADSFLDISLVFCYNRWDFRND